ncbi:carboxypeptidase M32 [Aestuariivirga litoralis]|uniref:Metal-dependent carboxypeptidase n=1 Tax=Aestuariivirga litoralis TaxID=2650924 RepID=A0A2W2AR42_9HYPH|nr:carboxypeptidase M32 [Aestuariivirga litoralis]PZF76112.1 carboxypeptidase M32 [Aestuariivirga litoralis]
MSFAELDHLCRRLEAIGHAQAMLGVDEAVNMPEGGGEKRAEAMGVLASMAHEMATAPHIADWIAKAETEELDDAQKAAVAEFKRSYINRTCLSSDFVARQVNAAMRCEQLWRSLRAKNDWNDFLPSFENIVALAQEEAERRAEVLKLSPYDALVEQYDPGSRSAEIARVFADLKGFLKGFIPEALEAQARRRAKHPPKALAGPFPIEKQKALGLELMKAVGFDFHHGRLDVSHHPFCGGVPSDVRMTTRYRTDEFLSSLMGILHETGHGLYEQNLPHDLSHWPSMKARGMAMHESQSLFQEMQLSRRPEFWVFALPRAREILGLEDVSVDDLLAHVHRVERGFIRVDADEATYPLHVILRFEIEQELVTGRLAAKDVPEAWNAKMTEYLGLSTAGNYKDGPMQDVHWPSGAFGYFPSYTLGAMMAAQQWAAVERAAPDAAAQIARGDFSAINAWRRENIWSKASMLSTPEIMRQATGEPLNARYFEEHLKNRYLTT